MTDRSHLPTVGRPSKTGLSVKLLGVNEYQRRYQHEHTARKTARRWYTGLSRKLMTPAQYQAAYRSLKSSSRSSACH